MLDKTAIMKELETHIDCIPDGPLGELLRNVRKLLVSNGKKLATQNKKIKALEAMESMYIARVKVADRK